MSRRRDASLAVGLLRAIGMKLAPVDLVRATALGLSLAFAAAVALVAVSEPAAMDFIAHYAASRLVLEGRGASIVDPAAILAAEHAAAPARVQLLPYLQVPALALLRLPLALLPYEAAFAVMALGYAAAIVTAVALLVPRDRLVAAMLVVAPPSAVAVAQAQESALALFLVALAIHLGGRRGSGVALGLTLLRIQSAPLLLLAGVVDPARRLGTILGASAVVALSAAVVGVDGLVRYTALLFDVSDILRTGAFGMRVAVGWSGLGLSLGLPQLATLAAVASLLVGAIVVVRSPPERRPAVAAAWSLLAAPNLLIHDAVLAYPALALLASRRSPWDVSSALVWLAHVAVAPAGALWSAVLAVAVGSGHRGR